MPPISRRGLANGLRDALPVQLAVIPFGAIFGALATEAGLDLVQAMAMTVIVVAGASQLAAVQLMAEDAPALLAILTGAVVNTRMAMYSAAMAAQWRGAALWVRALGAYTLHDYAYGLAAARHARRPEEPLPDRVGHYMAVGFLTCAVWTAASLAGALLGGALPEAWALEFAAPLAFVAVVAPLLRSLAHVAAAVTAAAAALAFAFLPFGLGLMVGAGLGIATGAAAETALERVR